MIISHPARLCAVFCLLTACVVAPQTDTYAIPELSLNILSDEGLVITLSGPGDFDITTDKGKTFFAGMTPYDEVSQGIGDWQIPAEMAAILQTDNACDAFTGQDFILPLKGVSLCERVQTSDGQSAVIAVGPGFTFEGNDYPGSMVILPRSDHAVILFGIADFPLIAEESQLVVTRFTEAYPDEALWPPVEEEQQKVYDDIEQVVLTALDEPTAEVLQAMEHLRSFASGLSSASPLPEEL